MAAPKKKPAAAPGPVVDLDAAEQKYRAEREAEGPAGAPVITFHGNEYQLVPEIPLEVILALADTDGTDNQEAAKMMVRSVRALFADGEWERFQEAKPSMANLFQLFDVVFTAYTDLSSGESEASEESSSTTGTPARQPSKPDTASSS